MGKGHKLENVAIRMVKAPPLYSSEPLKTPMDVVRVLGKELEAYDREVLCVVNLRSDLAPINMNIVSMGSLNASIIMTAREVFKSSILSNAGFIMMVHNHPSGNLMPSRNDMAVTKKIEKAAELMDIPLVDHIILGRCGEYFSFRSNGLMEADKEKLVQTAAERPSIRGEIREHQRKMSFGREKEMDRGGAGKEAASRGQDKGKQKTAGQEGR